MVSEPPAPERDSEITIDLDHTPEGDPEPDPRPPYARIPNAALLFVAVFIVLVTAAVAGYKWLPVHTPVGEATVRTFLEAVHDGDVDEALALAEDADGADQFLVADALDNRWEIVQIAQVAYEETPEGATAEVYAEIEAYDGTRVGYRYWVRLGEDGPVILNGLGRTEHDLLGFEELELNGYSVRLGDQAYVLLLPGVYEMYESHPSTMELNLRPVLALGNQFIELGGEHLSHWLPSPWPQLSAEGRTVLDTAIRSHLEGCVERAPVEGCPFAPPQGDDRIGVPADATWEITSYPQVNAVYTFRLDTGGVNFELLTTQPGSVEVDAVVTGPDGAERRTTLSCGIWMEGHYASFDYAPFDSGGGVTISSGSMADDACRTMMER